MKAGKSVFTARYLLLLLLCACFVFSTGCGSQEASSQPTPSPTPTASPEPTPTATPIPEKTISGILTQYSRGLLTLRAEDGKEYTFDTSTAPFTGLSGLNPGDYFTIGYQGELNREQKKQTVLVTSIEKTADADDPQDSIPLAWKDNGIFSANYSKAYVTLQSMTVEEKVGQLLLGRVPDGNAGSDVVTYHLGGYVTFGKDYQDNTRWQVQNMIQGWQSVAKIPLVIAVDEEGGEVVRVSSNPNLRSEPFASPQSLFAEGGMDLIRKDAKEKAKLLLDLGINVNLAPIADVSTDPADFIYSRTLGQGAEETADYVTTVMNEFQTKGLSAVLKHFPGYGTNQDTHAGASLDERSLWELENRDLIPFQTGIDNGAYSIMVSHNTVAAMDDTLPASLSPSVHSYLREKMGFTGIIMTDDLSMQAIAGQDFGLEHDVYVQAVLAGNDMLLCSDYQTAYQSILEAVKDGTIPTEMLDRSVFRILSWKCTLDLM